MNSSVHFEEGMDMAKSKIKPLADRIVVEPLEETEEMRGGLYIPDTAKEKPQQGTVIAVGPGRRSEKGDLIAVEISVGDRVLYGKYSGTEVAVDGTDYLIVKESDVLAVLG
ncbi:MAG: co-chaperone GroES [Gemmatimonadota bacterium]|jgi:chaperonin GroES